MKADQAHAWPSQNARKIQFFVGCKDDLVCEVLTLKV